MNNAESVFRYHVVEKYYIYSNLQHPECTPHESHAYEDDKPPPQEEEDLVVDDVQAEEAEGVQVDFSAVRTRPEIHSSFSFQVFDLRVDSSTESISFSSIL